LDTWQGRATLSKAFSSGIEFMLSGSYHESEGDDALYYPEFDTPAQNQGVFVDGDEDRAWNGFGSVAYGDFRLESGFVTRDKGNPTAQHGTTFNDNRHLLTDTRYYADLQFRRQLTDNLELIARGYYDRYEFEGTFPFSAGLVSLEHDDRLGQWYGAEVQFNRALGFYHTISVGGEFRHDFDQQRTYTQIEPSYLELAHTERDRLGYSGFVNGEFQLFPEKFPDKLSFNAGIRYDGYDQFSDAFNPRVALIYHPWDGSAWKAVYGTAFRTPNFFELFDPSNQDIDPEHVATYELIYEQTISAWFRATLLGFYNRIEDAIAFDFQPAASRYRNFEGVETVGMSIELEAMARGGPVPGLRGRVAYTLQDTENLETGERPADSPEHLVKAGISAPFWGDRLVASAELQYTSERTSLTPGPGGTLVPGQTAEDFVTVNFTLVLQKLVKNLEVSASVYNLFDEVYADPATLFHEQDLIPQNGRTFRVKATYRF
jgi:iron complex outermembrane receptor protein